MLSVKDVPDVMLLAPTSSATFSMARQTLRSDSLRFQSPKMARPPSPLSRRFFSSASVRIFPAARTFQGAKAIPIDNASAGGHSVKPNKHTMFDAHGEDIAFDIPLHDVPRALVDDEWGLACQTSVRVGL